MTSSSILFGKAHTKRTILTCIFSLQDSNALRFMIKIRFTGLFKKLVVVVKHDWCETMLKNARTDNSNYSWKKSILLYYYSHIVVT